MARPKQYDNRVAITIYLEKAVKDELVQSGVTLTKFFSQAVEAWREKRFEYKH